MKFKNIKKDKFPSNFRIIPASGGRPSTFIKIYRLSLKIFIAFIFIIAVVIVGLDMQKNIQAKKTIDSEREKLTEELIFWESFIKNHKDYRDAYFQASVLAYKLGNTPKAKAYAEKGLSLDPNSEDGRKIEEFLNK